MTTPLRIPAEAFPPGEFLQEEMDARGWSLDDLYARLGGDPVTCCAVEFVLHVHDKNLILDRQTSAALGRALDVSDDFFWNLDCAWRGADPKTGEILQ